MSRRFTRRSAKTADDEQRIQDIKEIGCICCRLEGLGKRYCEWDHLTVAGFTISHKASIGLCPWHHRGIVDEGYTTTSMTATYGPSKAKGTRTFFAHYGTKEFLLGYQDELIEELHREQEV